MGRRIIKYSIIIFSYLVVLCPLWIRYEYISWTPNINSILQNIFPGLGLLAFSMLWLHCIAGALEPWLRKYIDFDKYVHGTSAIILTCIILHPLLLLVILGFDIVQLWSFGKYVRIGMIGWLLLITYDIGRALKGRYNFFVRNWTSILFISMVGFLFTFFHSINLGTDLQSGVLRNIWIFYGITAIISVIYTYGIKKLLTNQAK